MKNLILALALLTSLLMGPLATAQTGDWQAVENLPLRSLISVEDTHHAMHDTCRFQGVVDGQLMCEYGPYFAGRNEIAFRRESVRAVRRDHNGALIGFSAGAGTGAVIGAAGNSTPGIGRGGSAVLGGVLLGSMGALVGSVTGHFVHGEVMYRNPDDTTQSSQVQDNTLAGDVDSAYDAAAYRIAAARIQYTRSEDAATPTNESETPPQFPTRRRGPMSPRGAYPRPAYPGMWRSDHSGRHGLIGALVGFGIGAAVGAKGGVPVSMIFGAVGAGIGAAIGSGTHPLPARGRYWRADSASQDDQCLTSAKTDPQESDGLALAIKSERSLPEYPATKARRLRGRP